MLTPNDIRNPKRKSGFDHVTYAASPAYPAKKPYQADVNAGGSHNQRAFKGPRRATALEAAWDYCNYVNGSPLVQPTARLKSAEHNGKRAKRSVPSDIEAARGMIRDYEAQVRGDVQGYVYLIAEVPPGGGLHYVKIGYSVNPEARVVELQTANPRTLKLLYAMPGTEADEKALHAKYIKQNVLQEWFIVSKEMLLEFPADCAKAA